MTTTNKGAGPKLASPNRRRSAHKGERLARPAAGSPLQLAIANRVRIVLSLCDQRADIYLSNTVVTNGMSRYLAVEYASDHTLMSRRIRGLRPWTPDLLVALCLYAERECGVRVDPGWLTYGALTNAPAPVIPKDLQLRENTTLDGLRRDSRTLRELNARARVRA